MTTVYISTPKNRDRVKTLTSLDDSPEILKYAKEPGNPNVVLQEKKKNLKEALYAAFIILAFGLSVISIIISASLKKENSEANLTEQNYFLGNISNLNKKIDDQNAEIGNLTRIISQMKEESNEKFLGLSNSVKSVDEKQEKNHILLDLLQKQIYDVLNNQSEFTQKMDIISTNLSNLNTDLINVTKDLVDTNLTQIVEKSQILQNFIAETETNKQYSNYMYSSEGLIVYDDIFLALEASEFGMFGNPSGWDATTYRTNPYFGKMLLCILNKNKNEGIILKTKDKSYTLLWLRVPSDMVSIFAIFELNDQNQVTLESWEKFGASQANQIAPDGGPAETPSHLWISIPLRNHSNYLIKTEENSKGWISGMALGQNLWNHVKNSADLFLVENSGVVMDEDKNVYIYSYGVLQVPVIPNGKDKILYFAGVSGEDHKKIVINGKNGERLREDFGRDVFAGHYSKNLYLATKIKKEWIGEGNRTVQVEIYVDPGEIRSGFYFLEVGTHDYI